MLKLYRASCQSVTVSQSVPLRTRGCDFVRVVESPHSRGSWSAWEAEVPSGFGRRSVGLAHPELPSVPWPLRVERFFMSPSSMLSCCCAGAARRFLRRSRCCYLRCARRGCRCPSPRRGGDSSCPAAGGWRASRRRSGPGGTTRDVAVACLPRTSLSLWLRSRPRPRRRSQRFRPIATRRRGAGRDRDLPHETNERPGVVNLLIDFLAVPRVDEVAAEQREGRAGHRYRRGARRPLVRRAAPTDVEGRREHGAAVAPRDSPQRVGGGHEQPRGAPVDDGADGVQGSLLRDRGARQDHERRRRQRPCGEDEAWKARQRHEAAKTCRQDCRGGPLVDAISIEADRRQT